MDIRYLTLLAGVFVVMVESRGEQPPAASSTPIDPYTPISAWAVCPPVPARDYDLHFTGSRELAPTLLSGKLAERTGDGKLTLIGDAEAQRGDQQLRAGRLIYDETSAIVETEGPVVYDEPLLNITGTGGKFWLHEDRGQLFNTHFWMYSRHGRGNAKKAYIVKPGVTRFKKALYTTCPQYSNTWDIRATKVTLDENAGTGVARNARLNIKDIPVLYTPYISFPIDDRRKTGFLIPTLGSSNNSGMEVKIPFYWNIAPNYDALFTPRYLRDRGTQWNTEFRFLQPKQAGKMRVEYLNRDKITDARRSRIVVNDQVRFNRNLTAGIDFDRVSDKDYLNDLGDSLSLASITHLQRTAQINYTTNWWQLGVRADDYQTLDRTITPQNRPYQRLPRVTFEAQTPQQGSGLEAQVTSEAVRFQGNQRITADRVDLWPSVSWPYRGAALDSTPKFGLRYTAYNLDNQPAGQPQHPARSTPFFSLDNVVYFERNLSIIGRHYTQTLEPRLFYLYVKGEDQRDLPLFDTSEPTFNYRELFEENRFNGADRMGDANQAALAVTTRLIDPDSGAERVRASVGQLFYFANRNVTLNNTAPQTNSESNLAGELDLVLSRSWSGKADLIWDPHDGTAERANARIQYQPGFRKIANISYRYLQHEQSQVDLSILWPLSPSWHVLGRWYYDFRNSKNLETLAGIEYDSCCWGVRFITRNYIDSKSNASNRVYMAQFVLKGLATFGSKIESVLEDGILGYTARPED